MLIGTLLILMLLLSSLFFLSSYQDATNHPALKVSILVDRNFTLNSSFQQMVVIHPVLYSHYESATLGNIRFCLADGNFLPAWIESITPNSSTPNESSAAVIWVRIPSGTVVNSNFHFYLVFEPKSVGFSKPYWGEAPQYSSPYGKNDNGANVFDFYSNFQGSSINSSVWNINSRTFVFDNGLFAQSPQGYWTSISSVDLFQPSMEVLDFYGGFTTLTNSSYPNEYVGWGGNGPVDYSTFPIHAITASMSNYSIQNVNRGAVWQAGMESFGTLPGKTNIWSIWLSNNSTMASVNYGTAVSDNVNFNPSPRERIMIASITNTSSIVVHWIRIRTIPPPFVLSSVILSTGVPPVVTFNSNSLSYRYFALEDLLLLFSYAAYRFSVEPNERRTVIKIAKKTLLSIITVTTAIKTESNSGEELFVLVFLISLVIVTAFEFFNLKQIASDFMIFSFLLVITWIFVSARWKGK